MKRLPLLRNATRCRKNTIAPPVWAAAGVVVVVVAAAAAAAAAAARLQLAYDIEKCVLA